MTDERIFPSENPPTKAEDYHGTSHFERTVPDLVEHEINFLTVEMTFEEALKLSLALQSCLMQLNRYHRGTIVGREMGVLLTLNMEGDSLAVIERRVHPSE